MPVIDAPSSTQILIVDDNQRMLRALERSIGTLDLNIHVHVADKVERALKLANSESYKLILVDLRLKEGNDAGLKLIEELAKQQKGILVLFTTNPCDPIINRRIEETTEKYSNFPCFIQEKGDAQTLVQLVESYLVSHEPTSLADEFDYSLIPDDLAEFLQDLARKRVASKNKRYYEDGEIFYAGKEKVEEVRTRLRHTLDSTNPKTEAEKQDLKRVRQQYEAIKGLWSQWLSEYYGKSDRSIQDYVDFYLFFRDPERYPYREKMGIYAFRLFNRKHKKGIHIDNPYVLSEEDREFLWHRLINKNTNELSAVEVEKYYNLRKQLHQESLSLPPFILAQLSTKPPEFVRKILPNIKMSLDASEGSIKQLEALIKQEEVFFNQSQSLKDNYLQISQKQLQQTQDKIANNEALSASSSPIGWNINGLVHLYRGNFQEAFSSLPSRIKQDFLIAIIEDAIFDVSLMKQLKDQKIKFLTMEVDEEFEEFKLSLEYHLLGSYVSYSQKILIYGNSPKFCQSIDQILQEWKKDLARFSQKLPMPDSHGALMIKLLTDLINEEGLYFIC